MIDGSTLTNPTGKLWRKVFNDDAKQRFVETVSGHLGNCRDKEIVRRQITIFKEVDEDLGKRLEQATGQKALDGGVAGMKFNGEFIVSYF